MDSLPDCITDDERKQIWELLVKHIATFAKNDHDIGETHLTEYHLQLKDPSLPPIVEPLRNHPVAYLQLIDDEVQKLQDAGIVVPCTSTCPHSYVNAPRKRPRHDDTRHGVMACIFIYSVAGNQERFTLQ